MTNPANDIVKQASQGSVAAIIQLLNEKLADSGVRTRAIFADGVLQLLCEAATLEQLEQSVLIERVRQVLEAIAPRAIRRVNINSRIVREQQLLWLEEINRDPENQLLWSQEITLKRPNLLQQLMRDWQRRRDELSIIPMPKRSSRKVREQQQFRRGLLGGAGLSLVLLGGWLVYSRWNAVPTQQDVKTTQQEDVKTTVSTPSTATATSATPLPQPATSPVPAPAPQDSFAAAVRIAERASQAGMTAKSSAEWLDLAARWQQASDLMATIPANDSRYDTAQDRVLAYRKNSESALEEAKRQQPPSSETVSATDTPPDPASTEQ